MTAAQKICTHERTDNGQHQAAFYRDRDSNWGPQWSHGGSRSFGGRRSVGAQGDGRTRFRPGTSTPEHLFAAGYAACFGGALDYVATQKKRNAKGAAVSCSVSIGPRDGGGFGLAVKLLVQDVSLPQAELAALAQEAHEKICPYSHATRGNVQVDVQVQGG
jgi:lipoyl-dependent peroxiredoxin